MRVFTRYFTLSVNLSKWKKFLSDFVGRQSHFFV